MITASECRELAKCCRERAVEMSSPRKANLLRNISHSFSSLATQLDVLAGEFELDRRRTRAKAADPLQPADAPVEGLLLP
jgi:hypothetical protein